MYVNIFYALLFTRQALINYTKKLTQITFYIWVKQKTLPGAD